MMPVEMPVSTMPFELPMTCATDAHEVIQWALLKEKHYPATRNPQYLADVQRHSMTATWRLRVCRWMFETAKEFELQMDTVANALHFLDQYLSVHSVDRVTLQLLGMICMWTASKMHEGKPILLEEMALMCDRKFSRAQMVEAEMQLVRLIGFQFSPPNVFTMARDFVNELPFDGDVDRRANCVASVFTVLERVVEDMASLGCSASSLAKAAVQLVAKSEYNLSVAQVLKALQIIKSEEVTYRAAFKVVRGAYFGSSPAATPMKSSQAAASDLVEPLKALTQSPTAIEQVPELYEVVDMTSSADDLDESILICTETLSPSPSQGPPAPVRTAASSTSIGVTRAASSPACPETDTERPNKRQRKLSM